MQSKIILKNRNDFIGGIKAAIPIAVGYLPIAVAFGVIAANGGINPVQSFSMSVFVFAGASQFMAAEMINSGVSAIEITLVVFMLNLRHFIMGLSVFHRLKVKSKALRALMSFGITDETFAVISFKEDISPVFTLGLMFFSYISWVLGTLGGGLFYNFIPPSISNSMAIGLYAMFVGLLVPQAAKNFKLMGVWGLGMAINGLLINFFSKGMSIILATLAAASLGSLFVEIPREEGEG